MSLLPAQRNLGTLRLYYFLLIGGGGFLFPFINLFFVARGLSGTEIGLLSTVASLAVLIAAPWWGRHSDRTVQPRRLLQFGLLATSLCMLALSQQTIFVWMALFVMLDALLSAGVAPLSDVVTLAVTKQDSAGFGSVRLWGSLGWAVTALVGGWLIERTGLFTMFAGYALSGLAGIALLALLRIPRWGGPSLGGPNLGSQIDRMEAAPARSLWKAVRVFAGDRTQVGLALALALLLFTFNGVRQFEPVFLNELGAGETIIGLASMIGAAVEVPGMWWVDRLARRYGAGRMLRLSFLLYLVCMLSVIIAPTVPMILFSHVIDGVAYSFFAVALAVFIGEVAPGGQVTTTMALFTVTLPAFIRMVSAPVGGWVFDVRGAYTLYFIAVAGAAAGWLVMKLMVKDASREEG